MNKLFFTITIFILIFLFGCGKPEIRMSNGWSVDVDQNFTSHKVYFDGVEFDCINLKVGDKTDYKEVDRGKSHDVIFDTYTNGVAWYSTYTKYEKLKGKEKYTLDIFSLDITED